MKKSMFFILLLVILDILLINISFISSFYIRFAGNIPYFNFYPYIKIWPIITIFFILILYLFDTYKKEPFNIYLFFEIFYAITLSYLFIIVFYYVFREQMGSFPSSIFFISWIINILLLSLTRLLILTKLCKKTILFVGKNDRIKRIGKLFKKKKNLRIKFYLKKINITNITKKIITEKIDTIVITDKVFTKTLFYSMIDKLAGLGVKIICDMNITDTPLIKTKIYDLNGIIFYEIITHNNKIWEIFLKRSFDIILSLILIILLFPIWILIGILIKIDSPGSIIFKQERIGKDYKKFTMYKFRTMIQDAEKKTGPIWSSDSDKRITKIGRILRKYEIDELPQLWNILKGEMSIVGPRPEREYFIKKYPILLSRRLSVRPGLTGLAQVNSSNLTPEEKVQYDLIYVKNQSLFLDLVIIKKTLSLLIKKVING